MHLQNKKLLLFSILVILITQSCSYLPEDFDKSGFENNIIETADYILITNSDEIPSKAFLFVPGGLVDPHVYMCWQDKFITENPDIAIISLKVVSNLAIVNQKKALKIIDKFPEVENWIIGGHSLGGVVASMNVSKNIELFDGLILMASWPTESSSLVEWEGAVLSISASKDGLSTPQEIEENKQFLPQEITIDSLDNDFEPQNVTFYYEINGGNHSGFGCYGLQEDDFEADISQEVQQNEIIQITSKFLRAIWN